MRLAIPASPSSVSTPRKTALSLTMGIGLGLVAATAAATLAHDRLFHPKAEAEAQAAAGGEAPKPAADPDTVALAEGKFKLAEIRVEPAEATEVPREVDVTGRIEADPNRRVEIRPKAQGVVRTMPALPGTKVRAGDVLVVLDSPDVGSARLRVRERQRELATARVEAAWKAEIAANVEAAIALFRRRGTAPDLFKQFANKPLGTAKGTLVAAYAEHELAEHEEEKMTDLKAKNIIGEHPLFKAIHDHEAAQARFDGMMEQVNFDVAKEDRLARQAARTAEEMVVDAAQRLRMLGVEEDIADLLAHPERASALPSGTEDLTAYPMVAPFDGTVISTSAVRSQRVDPADLLFVVADLSVVHAVAMVSESNFAALPGLTGPGGGAIRLTTPSYPGTFEAKVLYAGADVDPTTRAVRLVTETANPDGRLFLGMAIRFVLDAKETEKATTVPAAAVIEIDGKTAVFVPGKAERTFIKRPVKLGREALGRQVIAQGLKPGDRVVVAGAFLLKSELILQSQTDED